MYIYRESEREREIEREREGCLYIHRESACAGEDAGESVRKSIETKRDRETEKRRNSGRK